MSEPHYYFEKDMCNGCRNDFDIGQINNSLCVTCTNKLTSIEIHKADNEKLSIVKFSVSRDEAWDTVKDNDNNFIMTVDDKIHCIHSIYGMQCLRDLYFFFRFRCMWVLSNGMVVLITSNKKEDLDHE
jgi:hypothetical protein